MQPLARWFLTISIGMIVGYLAIFPKWTVDDAFISYRYGKNLATTGELTWNPGEDPVEGYTGIILPLIAYSAIKTGLPLVVSVKILSIISLLLAGWLIVRLSRRLSAAKAGAWFAGMLFFAYPFMYTHALSGLETILFLAAFLWAFDRWASLMERPNSQNALFLGGAMLVAGLMRPEGLLVAVVIAVLWLFSWVRKQPVIPFKWVLVAAGTFLVPAIAYFLWRMRYYGAVLPNTFYAKQYDGWVNPEAVLAWGRFLLKYLGLPAGAILLARLLIGSQVFPRSTAKAARNLTLGLGLFGGGYALFYSQVHLYMNYSYRFFIPLIPIGLILLSPGFSGVIESLKEFKNKYLVVLVSIITIGFIGVMGWNLSDELYFTDYYKRIVEEEYLPAAEFIRNAYPETAKLAVYMDAGAIPYYTGMKTVDFGGLNNEYLAQIATEEEKTDYFFSELPDVVVFTSQSENSYSYIPAAEKIIADPRFVQYKFVRQFGNSADFPYFQFVYFRRDTVE